MKKLKYLLVPLALLLCGCERKDNEGVNSENAIVFKTGVSYRGEYFEYIEVDGHEYLRWMLGYKGGITHSPRCWCNTERLR